MMELRKGLFAHPCGALWQPLAKRLYAADLHLGYGWAQRRRGELGPVATGDVDAVLAEAARELEAAHVVLLGDVIHAPNPAAREREYIEGSLARLRELAELTVVVGNHDRGLAGVAWFDDGEVHARHGHELPGAAVRGSRHCLYGHWHPVVKLADDAGAKHRLKAWLWNERATVLPAMSPFAAGMNADKRMPEDLREALGGPHAVAVTTGRRVFGMRR